MTLDVEQAAAVLGVPPDRVPAMVDEGLLHPVETDAGELRFDADEVRAVHDLGG